jgi:thioredoxin-related protein
MFRNILILNSFFGEIARGLGATILACALLAAATADARADAPPLTSDLAATLKLAREHRVPVFVAFTLKRCPYCIAARRDYWTPMHESAAWRAKTLMVEVMLDGEAALIDFDGEKTTPREFAKRFGIRSVPTVIVFDTQGKPAAEPVIGLASADFYAAYLERAIEQGLAKVRTSR